ncbi:MAG TPA: Uma2 family endonuclease [Verrucomicrobiae bacterium]|nr:Uma2 family endonuclease [Verrucomicrobiae bacterium]
MSALPSAVSVYEYLHTVYRPDCDYVDGVLVERNVGEKDHGSLQQLIWLNLWLHRKEWNIYPIIDPRVQVAATRIRVPDVCAMAGPEPGEQIFTKAPFLCVEILSPEDRMNRMQERIDDYLRFGVASVWVVDPQTRRAWIYTPGVMREVQDGVLRTKSPDIQVPLAEVFER